MFLYVDFSSYFALFLQKKKEQTNKQKTTQQKIKNKHLNNVTVPSQQLMPSF